MSSAGTSITKDAASADLSLADLLQLDDQSSHHHAIEEVFGDRYLCAHNALYRGVREHFASSGFRVATTVGPLHEAYGVLPLLCIQQIVETGIVPAISTTATIRRLAAASPSFTMPASFLLSTLRKNYVLHESAHCIAYSVLSPLAAGSEKRWLVLVYLLCEAYANAVERLAALQATPGAHQLFFGLNSFVDSQPPALIDSVGVVGFEKVLPLALAIFLRLNRRCHWSSRDTAAIVASGSRTGLGHPESIILASLAGSFAQDLNMTFIMQTTPSFFRFMGLEREYESVCSGDFVNDPGVEELLDRRINDLLQKTLDMADDKKSTPGETFLVNRDN